MITKICIHPTHADEITVEPDALWIRIVIGGHQVVIFGQGETHTRQILAALQDVPAPTTPPVQALRDYYAAVDRILAWCSTVLVPEEAQRRDELRAELEDAQDALSEALGTAMSRRQARAVLAQGIDDSSESACIRSIGQAMRASAILSGECEEDPEC